MDNPSQTLTLNTSGNAVVSSVQSKRLLTPAIRTKHLVELALHERNDIECYSIECLDEELQRQIRLSAEKGGLTPQEKFRLNSLMSGCMAELRAIIFRLDTQLIDILLR